jgi:hypothetical protein
MFAAIDLRVALISLVCLAAGLGLGYLTWWFWKSAQPESPALAALEVMSERRFDRADDEERARILDGARIDPTTVAPLIRAARDHDRRSVGRDGRPSGVAGEDWADEEWFDDGESDPPSIDPLLR